MSGVRLVGVVDVTCNVERQRSGLRGLEVEVTTIVETLVLVSVVVATVELLEQTALCVVTSRDEVLHAVGTTRDVEVVLLLEGDVLHDVVCPAGVREADRVATVLKLLDDALREARSEDVFCHEGIYACILSVGNRHVGVLQVVVVRHLVVEVSILVRAGLLHHLCRRECGPRSRDADLCLALSTALGGDEHHAVSTAHTEDGGSRSVLEHCDALYFVRVDVGHRTLHTIHLDERAGVAPCGLTTHEYLGGVATRLTRILHRGDTRELSSEHVVYRTH